MSSSDLSIWWNENWFYVLLGVGGSLVVLFLLFKAGTAERPPRGPRRQTARLGIFARTFEEYYADELYAEKVYAIAAEKEARLKRREEYLARKRRERDERRQHPSGEIVKQGGRAR